MHWNCVTVLFGGIRRNSDSLLLFEGITIASKDQNPLLGFSVGLNFSLDVVPPKETRLLDMCF